MLEIAFLLADGLSVDFVVALSVDVLSVAFWAVSLSDFLSVTFFVVVLSVVGVVLLEVAFTGVLSVEVLSEVCLSWETELVWFSLVLTVLLLVGCLSWVVAVLSVVDGLSFVLLIVSCSILEESFVVWFEEAFSVFACSVLCVSSALDFSVWLVSWVVAVVWSALLASSDAFVVALSVAWSSVLAVSLVLVS